MAKSYTRTPGIDGGIGGIVSQITPTVTQYFHFDHLGSTTVLTNTAGNKYEYDAFGNLISALDPNDPNSYRFSGKENDSKTGLIYFGARYYDPEVGRWLSPDPSGFADGLNVYLYVNNNPVNLIDPYGLMGEMLDDLYNTPDIQAIRNSPIPFVGIVGTEIKGVLAAKEALPLLKVGKSCWGVLKETA